MIEDGTELTDDFDTTQNNNSTNSNSTQYTSTSKELIKILESFQKCRSDFVKQTTDYSRESKSANVLHAGGATELLIPLLMDPVRSIRVNAAISLGQLASSHVSHAEEIAKGETLHQLVFNLQDSKDKYFNRAGAYILRSIAKHNVALAGTVLESGAVELFVNFLTLYDPMIKEAGAWGLDYMARHNAELAQSVVDYGGLQYLVQCIQEPDMSIKRVSMCVLADIAKHSTDLAQRVIESSAVKHALQLVSTTDILLKRQICCLLAQVAKHTKDSAGQTINAMSSLPDLMTVRDSYVLNNTVTYIGAVAKHGEIFCKKLVEVNGLFDFVTNCIRDSRLRSQYAACVTVGKIAACGEVYGMRVRDTGSVAAFMQLMSDSTCPVHIVREATRSIGIIGSQSASLASEMGQKSFKKLYELISITQDFQLRNTCSQSLQSIISHCNDTTALCLLLNKDISEDVLELVLSQLAIILPQDANQRLLFMKAKKLELVQQIGSRSQLSPSMAKSISTINESFPSDAVKYYTPNYERELWNMIGSGDDEMK